MASVRSELHHYMEGLVSRLRDLLPGAFEQWDEDAIHDSRVATRRLGAALDVLRQAANSTQPKRFARALRRLRRRLGPLRDMDVMLGHLHELHARPALATAAAWASARLAEKRDRLRGQISREYPVERAVVDLGAWWGMRIDRDGLDARVTSLLHATIPRLFEDFARRADGLAWPREPQEPQDPHALRIAGKVLRYTLELGRVVGIKVPRATLTALKRLQDALGLWHDYVVLSQEVMRRAAKNEIAYHDPRLYQEILDLSRVAWNHAGRRLRHFATLWTRTGPRLRQALEQTFRLPDQAPADTATATLAANPTRKHGASRARPAASPSRAAADQEGA